MSQFREISDRFVLVIINEYHNEVLHCIHTINLPHLHL